MYSHRLARLPIVTLSAISMVALLSMMSTTAYAQQKPYAEWPDDHWADVAQQVPGFAGWWLNGGTIVLMLVDTTQREAALRAIIAELPQRYIHSIRVQKADFDFRQLRDWKALVFSVSGVVMSDADEVRNRVVAGVEDSTNIRPTRQRLLEAGIPARALLVEVTGRLTW